jgi:colanic acid biosynthesis glycosyl transferase WcaI
VSTIPNFVDTEFIRPLDKANQFSRDYGLTHKFVVTHAGNVGYVYDLETLVDAAMLLRSQSGVQFLIVGDGVVRRSLEAKVRALELANVSFLPYQPRETLPYLRAASDVQVALYKKGASRYSMPSKVYEIMASGRPVLASADIHSDLWNLVANTQCGICLEPQEPNKLASAVMTLYKDPNLRSRMGARGRHEVDRRYSVRAVVDQYDELIRSIDARRRPIARLLEHQAWH